MEWARAENCDGALASTSSLIKPEQLIWLYQSASLRRAAGVAQSVEQLIRNEKVGGSIPLTGTISGKGPASAGLFAFRRRNRRTCRSGAIELPSFAGLYSRCPGKLSVRKGAVCEAVE